jgi:DNA-binding beta-propeller fold protein YncE
MRIYYILLSIFSLPFASFGQDEVKALFVGNNKGGTVSVINTATLELEKTIDVAPDRNQKIKQTLINRYVNRRLGPKYVDDIDLLPDGRTIIVSRPYFMDIAAFDINTGEMVWKLFLNKRPDHQVMTKNGKHLFVSLLTCSKGVKIDLENQEILGYYKTGSRPHSIVLNKDESILYNGSLKGKDIVLIDTETLERIDRLPFPEGVRPFKISNSEEVIYSQLSYCHCMAEYDIKNKQIIKKTELPIPDFVKEIPMSSYPFEAAHHGIGIEEYGEYMSIAATVSNYVAILSFPEMEMIKKFDVGIEPSWITNGFDGDTFFVSSRGSDSVFVFSYHCQELVKEIKVGDYPQRMTKGIWKKE